MRREIGVTASASLGLQRRGWAPGRGRGDPTGACAAPGAGEGLAAASGSYLALHGGCQPNPGFWQQVGLLLGAGGRILLPLNGSSITGTGLRRVKAGLSR